MIRSIAASLVLLAAAPRALAQQSVSINLAGVQFKNATNQSRTSAPATISPAPRYAYTVDGLVKGDSGALKSLFPNPTPLAQVLETLSPGSSAALAGAVNNPAATHPVILLSSTTSGSTVLLGITVTYATTLTVGIDASGAAYFTLTDVTLSPAFLLGSMTVTSGSADIRRVQCPADTNADEFVDGLDYDAFIGAFLAGDAAADFNADGFVDGLDYDGFVGHFLAGC